MLRIHFTGDDLARVRVLREPDPMWELVLSLHVLQRKDVPPWLDQWQARLLALSADSPVRAAIRFLAPLNPASKYFPDFLTPAPSGGSPDTVIDDVLHTPAARMRRELAILSAHRPLPPWTTQLARGKADLVRALGKALRTYRETALAPWAGSLRAAVDADRAVRARAFLENGVDGLLASLRPTLTWEPPVLWADYPVEQTVHLDDRGLVLIPSFFCLRRPVTCADPALAPVLVYPVAHDPAVLGRDQGRTLGRLLGRTRAAVLELAEAGATTGELARLARISPASASEHVGVLRAAGLVASRRDANSVLHTVTPLGARLLQGS
ncbi:DNA-binding transcriptional ArsR family regulator [Amycolatopsis bartoniae]|uniref:Transcriptional regulator n=1 Tax=Amycolatopsis bartoniae TaxID=941986 RepID=A0A8H9MC54_9PSEU|nr:winged helix-turn-helix domain-containing protein [Amycolatopsis bartoniae]MBB2936936.1 DNA-binding transcriptional ArsR family regulator [Amycolatopsis bartoniae]TVT01694.1 winged helix-turn-helix transcriptional regulator [Amycolatopsis bartoniae]GHF51324.1 transcriptional regulator [Amycolatopsis bartoniae]